MKKLLILILAMVLCLAGCNEAPPELTSDSARADTHHPKATVPPETTLPVETAGQIETEPLDPFPLGSTGEKTNGTLRSIHISSISTSTSISHIRMINGKLLLVWDGMLQIRSTEDGSILQSKAIDDFIQTGDGCLAVKDNIFAYYNLADGGVVFRDDELNTIKVVPIPQELSSSNVLISDDLTMAYHFVDNTVYETNLETQKTNKLFRATHNLYELSDLILDGTVIVYWGKDSENDYFAYASLETGEDLAQTRQYYGFRTESEEFLLEQIYAEEVQYLLKGLSGETWELDPLHREEYGSRIGGDFLETGLFMNWFYALDKDYNSNVFLIELYDLSTGKRISEITCGGPNNLSETLGIIHHVMPDPQEPYIWIIGRKGRSFTLYRWNYASSAIQDEAVYLQKK